MEKPRALNQRRFILRLTFSGTVHAIAVGASNRSLTSVCLDGGIEHRAFAELRIAEVHGRFRDDDVRVQHDLEAPRALPQRLRLHLRRRFLHQLVNVRQRIGGSDEVVGGKGGGGEESEGEEGDEFEVLHSSDWWIDGGAAYVFQRLNIQPTETEIRNAAFEIGNNKAPGPDGFGSHFFKHSWELIKDDVTAAIQEFFRKGRLLKQFNTTFISLIPKVEKPFLIKEFRPISCCNTILKIISKIPVSKIRPLLDDIVAVSQGAFVPGRSIAHNAAVAHELVKGYERKGVSPRCMIQVDLQKAYDSVRWEFIEEAMIYFNFPTNLITWIMQCVTTPWYSIIINGEPKGFFKGEKGLRQGDPLSPFLFVLIMEMLNRKLSLISKRKGFCFHPKCKKMGLTNIAFADDLLIFCKPNISTLRLIKKGLLEFGKESGLSANASKSKVFFGGINANQKSEFVNLLSIEPGHFPIRYLGLPLHSRRLKVGEYLPLLNKIISLLQRQNVAKLSYAGRVQVIKSMIEGILSFWMHSMILPKKVVSKIIGLCRSYLWSGSIEGKRSLVAWVNICKPVEEGGLNFKELLSWNKTLIFKLGFDIFMHKVNLWTAWAKHNLLKRRWFWTIKSGSSDSWLWKYLIQLKDQVISKLNIHVDVQDETLLRPASLVDKKNRMCSDKIYDIFRSPSEKKEWNCIIWKGIQSRKWSFHAWLATLRKLPTASTLFRYGIINDDICVLCHEDVESEEHLWFNCKFVKQVTKKVLDWAGIKVRFNSPLDWWNWLLQYKRKKSNIFLTNLLAIMGVLYYTWWMRNEIIFRNIQPDTDTCALRIIDECKLRILSS